MRSCHPSKKEWPLSSPGSCSIMRQPSNSATLIFTILAAQAQITTHSTYLPTKILQMDFL
ncbi:unnamed protein product [Choristocarpus tenellus]